MGDALEIGRMFQIGQQMKAQREEKERLDEDRKLERDLLQHRIRELKIQEQLAIRTATLEQAGALQGTDPERRLPRNIQDILRRPAELPEAPEYNVGQQPRTGPSSMGYLPMEIPGLTDPETGAPMVPGFQQPIGTARDVEQKGIREAMLAMEMDRLKAEQEPWQGGPGTERWIGGKLIGKVPPTPKQESQPSIIQEYLFQAQEDIKAGKQPSTFDEYQTKDANRKRNVTNVNVGGTGLSQPLLNRVTTISNQFDSNPVIKNYNEQWNRVEGIKAILSREWSGPGDMATVFEFMKALDPTSVVRESEYATAAKTGNIFSGWAAKFNGYVNPQGGFLSDQVKKDFVGVLEKRVAVSKGQVKRLHGDFSRRIDNLTGQKGTGEQFLTDYSTLYEDTPSGSETGAPPATMYATNPQTGEKIKSNDGGQSWEPAQ